MNIAEKIFKLKIHSNCASAAVRLKGPDIGVLDVAHSFASARIVLLIVHGIAGRARTIQFCGSLCSSCPRPISDIWHHVTGKPLVPQCH